VAQGLIEWCQSFTGAALIGQLLLCMLAYAVQRTMERALAPLLYKDEAIPPRHDPVAPAPRSAAAIRKQQTKRTAEGWPVHSFRCTASGRCWPSSARWSTTA